MKYQDTTFTTENDSADMLQTKTNLLLCKQMYFILLGFVGIPVLIGVLLHNLYIGCYFLFCGLFGVVYWVIRTHYSLHFTGNCIYVVGILKKQNYVVYDIPASDLMISQTNRQKKTNTCDIKIKGTIFNLLSVEKCDELKEYIKTHFE